MLTPLQYAIAKLTKLSAVQSKPGIYDYNSYSYGLANGVILALSILEDVDPIYLPHPKTWHEDEISANLNPTTPEIAINITKNTGFNSICLRNPWRYLKTL